MTGDATGPAALVLRGPHRHVRHPLYVAVAFACIGVWIAYGRWQPADCGILLVVLTAAHLTVTHYEEPGTRSRIGPVYDLYCGRVPRWLPRIFPAEMADLASSNFTATGRDGDLS